MTMSTAIPTMTQISSLMERDSEPQRGSLSRAYEGIGVMKVNPESGNFRLTFAKAKKILSPSGFAGQPSERLFVSTRFVVSGELPQKFAIKADWPIRVRRRYSRRESANSGLHLSRAVYADETCALERVLRATGRYSIRRSEIAATPTSRSFSHHPLKAHGISLFKLK